MDNRLMEHLLMEQTELKEEPNQEEQEDQVPMVVPMVTELLLKRED